MQATDRSSRLPLLRFPLRRVAALRALVLAFAVCALAGSAAAQQIVTVSPVLGNPTASGTQLLATLASLTPSPTVLYLLKVEPGIYDLGDQTLSMRPYVDIEGSGRDRTIINGSGRAPVTPFRGVVEGASHAEIRNLTIQAFGDPDEAGDVTIAVTNAGSGSFRDLIVRALDGESCWGFRMTDGTPWLEDLEIRVICDVYNAGVSSRLQSRPALRDLDIRTFGAGGASGNIGVWIDRTAFPTLAHGLRILVGNPSGPGIGMRFGNGLGSGAGWLEVAETHIATNDGTAIFSDYGLSLKVRHSNLVGNTIGIDVGGDWLFVQNSLVAGSMGTLKSTGSISVGASQLDGGPVTAAVSATCAGTYDESFAFFPSTCPP